MYIHTYIYMHTFTCFLCLFGPMHPKYWVMYRVSILCPGAGNYGLHICMWIWDSENHIYLMDSLPFRSNSPLYVTFACITVLNCFFLSTSYPLYRKWSLLNCSANLLFHICFQHAFNLNYLKI